MTESAGCIHELDRPAEKVALDASPDSMRIIAEEPTCRGKHTALLGLPC